MTAVERLEALLNAKDEELAVLNERVLELQETLRGVRTGWMQHVMLPQEQALPVPRLELVYEPEDGDWYAYTVTYRLVYRHLLGHCVGVPLGHTRDSGVRNDLPFHPETGKLYLPFRDGAHIRHDRRALGFAAYAILGEHIELLLADPPGGR